VYPFFLFCRENESFAETNLCFGRITPYFAKNATVRKQAGESRGVALLPLGGLQRTATPTA